MERNLGICRHESITVAMCYWISSCSSHMASEGIPRDNGSRHGAWDRHPTNEINGRSRGGDSDQAVTACGTYIRPTCEGDDFAARAPQ